MNPIKIFLYLASFTIFITSANALTLKMCSNYTSQRSSSGYNAVGDVDWQVIDSVSGKYIKGLGICSSSSGRYGTSPASYANLITFSSTTSSNKYCWCRIIYPFVSDYVRSDTDYSTSDACIDGCAQRCSYIVAMGSNAEYVNMMVNHSK